MQTSEHQRRQKRSAIRQQFRCGLTYDYWQHARKFTNVRVRPITEFSPSGAHRLVLQLATIKTIKRTVGALGQKALKLGIAIGHRR